MAIRHDGRDRRLAKRSSNSGRENVAPAHRWLSVKRFARIVNKIALLTRTEWQNGGIWMLGQQGFEAAKKPRRSASMAAQVAAAPTAQAQPAEQPRPDQWMVRPAPAQASTRRS